MWARSLAYDGDLDLANDYRICGDPWGLGAPVAPGLRPRNPWGVGPAVVWAPALLVGRAFEGAGVPAPGCAGLGARLAMALSALAAAAAVALAYRVASRRVSRAAALLGAAAAAVGTPLAFYATVAPAYGHAISALAVALFFERWTAPADPGGPPWPRPVVLGLCVGFAALVRAQNVLLGVLVVAEVLRAHAPHLRARAWRAAMPGLGKLAVFGVTVAAVFAPQAYAWKLAYRHYLVTPQGPHFMRWSEPDVAGVLFSEAGGLLAWNRRSRMRACSGGPRVRDSIRWRLSNRGGSPAYEPKAHLVATARGGRLAHGLEGSV
jgi:hypothetical protein